uniref:Uncharacterized protein n=1 Tax=Oryza rufipogon TaxID=4529 RepID=A0A0E0QU39_ORYRU
MHFSFPQQAANTLVNPGCNYRLTGILMDLTLMIYNNTIKRKRQTDYKAIDRETRGGAIK